MIDLPRTINFVANHMIGIVHFCLSYAFSFQSVKFSRMNSLLLISLLAITESTTFDPDVDGFYRIRKKIETNFLNFTVLGDWGGSDEAPYTTENQIKSAELAEQVSTRINSSFTLGIGDNFYSYGVKSADDDRFKFTFEDVYSGTALQNPCES